MDIEEDIKILEKFKNNEMQRDKLERDSRCGGWKIGDIYKKLELNIAIDHILAEREEDKKKIDKLQVLEDDLKDKRIVYVDTPEFAENYIPKQKVKDKFNKLITRIKEFKEPERKKYFSIEQIIDLLEQFENKLLEDK